MKSIPRVTRFCPICGSQFVARRDRPGIYCSPACYHNRPKQSPIDLFWAKVDKSGGPDACWPWLGGLTKGYGSFQVHRKKVYAHRFAWETANYPVPPGMHVLHHCDNPPCCNPSHLFIGTNADNAADRVAKGRGRYGGNILTQEIADTIRARYAAGETNRRTLGQEFGVSAATIWYVVTGRTWRK